MLKSLFVNATMLISFIYLVSQLLREEELNINNKIKIKISLGLLTGLSGCALIFYGINLSNNTIIDFRVISVMIASLYGGFVSAFISVFIIIIFRLAILGINYSSLVASINMIVLLICFSLLSKYDMTFFKKYTYMTILSIVSSIIWISLVLRDLHLVLSVLGSFIFSIVVLSVIVYYILDHMTKTNETYRKLKFESKKDFLTGLNNAREFDSILNRVIDNALERNENLSMLMIDIDYFKHINDTHGHAAGDLVLKQLSRILVNSCRTFDIVSRNGGEEFTAILLDCNYIHAMEIAEKIRRNVQNNIFLINGYVTVKITVSIGVSSYPDITKDINTLLSQADKSLYSAKRTGRNKVC